MISAIILAAGDSSRMGTPKALLKIGDKTFLQHIVEVLNAAGIHSVFVVLGAKAAEIQKSLCWFDGTAVVNEDWQKGQLASLLVGLQEAKQNNPHAVLAWPVDRPLVDKSVIMGLINRFWAGGVSIVVPSYKDKRGHPTLFGKKLFLKLEQAPIDIGARAVLWSNPNDVIEYQAETEGVLVNVDTPEIYQEKIVQKLSNLTFLPKVKSSGQDQFYR